MQTVIFSDLDGTLLDHYSYSHSPADKRIRELEEQHIPLVLCTSKTRAELLELRNRFKNHHPFIVENGAAIFIPVGYFPEKPTECRSQGGFWIKELSHRRDHWLELLNRQKPEFGSEFRHFQQIGPKGIAELTGLTLEAAALANQREYGEPIAWSGNSAREAAFKTALERQGAQLLRGGRFLHLSGACNKGKALKWLASCYQLGHSIPPITIAAGDSHNDIAMLEAADWSLIVRSPVHPPPKLQKKSHVLISSLEGPAGWSEGLGKILAETNQPTNSSTEKF